MACPVLRSTRLYSVQKKATRDNAAADTAKVIVDAPEADGLLSIGAYAGLVGPKNVGRSNPGPLAEGDGRLK